MIPTRQQKINATIIWIGGVISGQHGYLVNSEIADGIATLAEEYLALKRAEGRAAQRLGRKGGVAKSKAKAQAARENGGKGGRPAQPEESLTPGALAVRRHRAKKKGEAL